MARNTTAQVLPNPCNRSRNMIHPTQLVILYKFCLIKLSPKGKGEAAKTLHTPVWTLGFQGVVVQGSNPTRNLLLLCRQLLHKISSRLDRQFGLLNLESIQTKTHCPLCNRRFIGPFLAFLGAPFSFFNCKNVLLKLSMTGLRKTLVF